MISHHYTLGLFLRGIRCDLQITITVYFLVAVDIAETHLFSLGFEGFGEVTISGLFDALPKTRTC
jgi:hypothetical protein